MPASLTLRRLALLLPLIAALAACATQPETRGPTVDEHVPLFARAPFEPFNRQDTVAIALREWRLFGSPVDDSDPRNRPARVLADQKPERLPGLWERVGEYWWIGENPGLPETSWTGKHDAGGHVFPPTVDGHYAWSAAFISYVMRIAGAGDRFPYAPSHSTYVNAAARGESPILVARAPESYAPRLGDLICLGRGSARNLRFRDLPTRSPWPGHCAIVVQVQPPYISIIGGNVNDAVTLTHVPVTMNGMLATPDGHVLDTRFPWFVVLEVRYDAEAEPIDDE